MAWCVGTGASEEFAEVHKMFGQVRGCPLLSDFHKHSFLLFQLSFDEVLAAVFVTSAGIAATTITRSQPNK